MIHIGAKLRTRFLKRTKFMVIGEKIASCSFVEDLLNLVTKDKHKLREGDLNLNDKMNYGAVERLCSPHVAKLLSTYVAGIYTKFHAKLFFFWIVPFFPTIIFQGLKLLLSI